LRKKERKRVRNLRSNPSADHEWRGRVASRSNNCFLAAGTEKVTKGSTVEGGELILFGKRKGELSSFFDELSPREKGQSIQLLRSTAFFKSPEETVDVCGPHCAQ